MTRTRLSVDIDKDLKQRIELAAGQRDQSIGAWIEHALQEALERQQDHDWLQRDLSSLENFEPYEFQEGDLERGDPVEFLPGEGYVVVRTSNSGSDDERQ
jgi:hypothetical protein